MASNRLLNIIITSCGECPYLRHILIGVKNVREEMLLLPKKERGRMHFMSPSKERSKLRSKTFPGIAKAMAEQWGGMQQ